MVSARWVHYAQFIEAVQLWLERPRLSGGRPRAATIFGIAAARMGGDGRAAVVARLAFPIARLPAWAAAGFLTAWWAAALILAQGLPPELEGKDLVAEGVIVSL